MFTEPSNILIFIGIILIIVEMIVGAATGFDLLLLGVNAIVGGVIGLLTKSFNTALLVTVILSLAYIFIGRKTIRNILNIETTATNTDNLIGKSGLVIKKIARYKAGQVKIDGEIWRAHANIEIGEGETVVVKSVTGVTLNVTT